MKNLKLTFIFIFTLSCDDDPVSSGSSSACDSNLAGTWVMTASGVIEGDTGDCTANPPTETSTNASYVLSEDCSFTSTSDIFPCNDQNGDDYSDNCTGNWSSTSSTIFPLPNAYQQLSSMFQSILTFTLNSDNTKMNLFLPIDNTNDDQDNPDSCQYTEYTKQ